MRKLNLHSRSELVRYAKQQCESLKHKYTVDFVEKSSSRHKQKDLIMRVFLFFKMSPQ
ncbi:MAG: hypothetical protein IPJ47_22925 [Anaerolineales bacterium]|nr:hypothetical protein [Anaerolineales bacterium]